MNDAHMDQDDADQPTRPLEAAGAALAETVEDLEDDVLILQARVRTLEQVVARLPGAGEIIAAVGDDEPPGPRTTPIWPSSKAHSRRRHDSGRTARRDSTAAPLSVGFSCPSHQGALE